MRSGAEDPHLVDVELVEGDAPLGPGTTTPAPAPGTPTAAPAPRPTTGPTSGPTSDPGTRSHVRAWLALATLAAVAAVLLAAQQAGVRRDQSRLAALAEVPGFLEPLVEPLGEVWRAAAGRPIARTPTAVLTLGVDSTAVLQAWDLATGEPLWVRDGGRSEVCRPLVGARTGGPDLPLVRHVVCVPSGGWGVPVTGRIAVVDAATGTEVRSMDVEGALFADVVDRLVLLTFAEPDGAVAVRAWQPVTGGDAWTHRSEPGLLDALAASGDGRYVVRDGVLSVGNREHGFTLAVATGEPPRSGSRGGPSAEGDAVVLPGGAEARWRNDRFGRPHDAEVVDAQGRHLFAAPGVPWLAPVTDGSAPGVVVVRRTTDQHLLGLDLRDGRIRWDLANVPWLSASVQVDGLVVGVGPSSAVVLDVATGLRLWDHGVARGVGASDAVTDGRLVLLPEEGAGGARHLAARHLRTGEEAWTVPLPADVVSLQQVDGHTVLVVTEGGIVALR